ncbi:phospho-sugar mutase [Candidatus Borkfalkia ceftriaxoniphila]|uniref:phosphoglucomutase (alpha-D-glucose-1,6-bisphosphate-dependent) n=1 Tax=Candidatus Borkfalkia ceftriaxoniphila TaxID=2508949 RepID=A0A4Q2KDZ9_9FIRM|nr:phospho-sugar mutase [Candidatus Borkfalkia ceftriaxoniphila]RXZ62249.1 phospho-sugar mutase [Candidatus Borkfalkia ceftriaxoniphila]
MDYKEKYESWLKDPALCEEGKAELSSIAGDEKAIEYRFGAQLEFGTAGMRGIIGYGTNMMNVYTVRRATQGLAEYVRSLGEAACRRGVAISFDTRRKSDEFAKAAAGVLAANGVRVWLYNDVHPVPMLSYAVRKLGAVAGIMITASHNPKEYNGYKVYGEDGAQMSPDATADVVKFISAIGDCFAVKEERNALIRRVPASVDKSYYKNLTKLSLSRRAVRKVGKDLKLVYTPVHGSGYVPVTTILKKLKINVSVVEEQVAKDPDFSTVEVPNPEFKETLSKGIALADKIHADAVFGTDPDSDRLGVAVKNEKGEFVALSGNQVGILLLDYILTRLKEEGKLPENGAVVKSFVTTGMAKAICDDFGVELLDVPVGFKFIGEKIKEFEADGSHTFLFGFEESCGYLRGTDGSRDKDAVVASMLFAELCCYYTYKQQTVYQHLMDIYAKYQYVLDRNVSIKFDGLNAMKEMNAVVDSLKSKSVEKFDIYNVVAVRDYSSAVRRLADGTEEKMDIPTSNAVYYELENGSFICVRPSGTEPKLKIYYSVKAKDEESAEKALERMRGAFEKMLK